MEKTYTLGDTLPDGSIYLGCVNGEHSSLVLRVKMKCGWDFAMANYMLPNRHEGLFIWELKKSKPDLFDDESRFWLSETYKEYAFYQWLGGGRQHVDSRASELSVRAVRRFKSFNDLIILPQQAALNDITELESQTGLILAGLREFIGKGD